MDVQNLMPPKRSSSYAYAMGYDCGLRGADLENCHFSIFSTRENTRAWEAGKRDAESGKPKLEPAA